MLTAAMEGSTTLNQNWMIFRIFAGLIACIVMLVCLNHGHETVKLLTLSYATMLPTSMSSKSEAPAPMVKDDICDIFDGKWAYDPSASPLYHEQQCPFLSDAVRCQRNGRPDSDYERWNWKAKGCDIPRFNGTDMLERIRGKRLIIVGDSLNRNQWESMACLLYSSIPASWAHVDYQRGFYKVFKAKDYNCSVEFYWSPLLVQMEVDKAKGLKILRLDKLDGSAKKWQGADIMVFNSAHWWGHQGKFRSWDLFEYEGKLIEDMDIELAYGMGMKTWANWIDQNVESNKTSVFFRSYSPTHSGQQCNKTEPIMDDEDDEFQLGTFPKALADIAETTFGGMRTPVKFLDITKLTQYRQDAHPEMFSVKPDGPLAKRKGRFPDCSHWCLPGLPDTWNSLLYASMVLDNTIHGSTS